MELNASIKQLYGYSQRNTNLSSHSIRIKVGLTANQYLKLFKGAMFAMQSIL